MVLPFSLFVYIVAGFVADLRILIEVMHNIIWNTSFIHLLHRATGAAATASPMGT